MCRRGDRCKFYHPAEGVGGVGEGQDRGGAKLQDKMEFCHDFQNGRCHRPSCKFIHCEAEVEAEFRASGYLPPGVRDQVINKAGGTNIDCQLLSNNTFLAHCSRLHLCY